MRILLHICCSNCAIYPIKSLTEKHIGFKGFWFNPNIHPQDEYALRLSSLRSLQAMYDLDVDYIDYYGEKEFTSKVQAYNGIRCEACYEMRLERTALTAYEQGMDGFSTTLLSSPYQRFGAIVDIGRQIGKKYNVMFFGEDFRPGWRDGVSESKRLGLYRQNYCGCIYSLQERKAQKSAYSGAL